MNCRACNLDDARDAREKALTLLRTPGQLPQEEIDKAVACCDCYSNMAAIDAANRRNLEY